MRHPTPKLQTSFRLSRLARALAAGSLLSVGLPAVQAAPPALPTGLSVAAGQAQVNVNGSHMTVTNSSQAILNWNSFSIGQGAAVYFQQPNASSQVLNRVTGSDPSAILGNLGSNGKVWLLNPNGVLFGATARIDVGGMVASTLRMSDLDWTGGRYRLAADAQDLAASGVRNQGEIRTAQGGSLALIAGTVGNEGLMRAPGGQVVLAAGQTVELVDTGSANLSVRVTAPSGQARNLGMIEAAGGRIDITAAAVNQDGIVRADALRSDPGGEVWIRASESIDLAPSSQTTADGGRGGLVSLQAASGRTTVQGTLSARGTAGSGGQAVVLGPEIGLLDGSRIDVSGVSAGGLAVVGGGAAGKDPRFVNARALYVSQQASISADATGLGDGGQIFLWSDTATRAYGAFSARGGQSGGNGGFIETSGGWLDARPSAIDTLAPMGRSGQWLLDPYNILIGDQVQNTLGSGPVFTAGGLGSSINSLTITAALANGNNVIISTGGAGGGTEAGNISLVNANINVAEFVSGRPGSLTLFADASISMLNSSIRSSIGAMPVTFLASQSAAGGISLINSTIVTGFSGSSNISGGFGAIALTGGAAGVAPGGASFSGAGGAVAAGLSLVNSRLDAGSAPVTLRGVSTLAAGTGVQMDASSSVVSGMLAITGDGSAYRGMDISGSLFSSGALSLQGRGAEVGVLLSSASVAANGRINITAGSVNLAGSTRVSSTATGDAILIADAAGPLARFSNTVGSQALSVLAANGPAIGGRWIVYATDIKDAANYAPGGLLPAFRRYGARYGAWSADAGNGLVFSTNEFATVSGNVNPRVYNGTTNATLASASVSTSVQGDSASLVNGSASFATKNVGTGIAVTLNAAQPIDFQSADGAAVFGYTIISTLSGNITPATLSLSGLSAANKVYDATTLATLAGTATVTPLGNDVVSISGLATARFADKNVGTAKPVSVSGLTLTGADAGNYILAPLPSFSADITRATLSLAGLSAANKVYDTTTLATIFGAATIVPLGNDAVSISGLATARFADKNVGTAKSVSLGNLTLTGADAGNYRLAPLPSLSADITRATLSLAGLSAANKVYDATTLATLFGTATITALGNDVVSISGLAVGSFADKNVGTDKPVSVGGLTLTGADAGNYRLAPLPNLRADITRATLSLAGLSAANKVYDATNLATLFGTAAITALGNDLVSVSGLAVGSFADKNVGRAKSVSVSGLILSGADAANYMLAPLASLSADITRATLTLAGLSAGSKIYDGSNTAPLSGIGSVSFIPGDAVTLVGTALANFANANVGLGKPVTVSGLTLAGTAALNYNLLLPTDLAGNIELAILTYIALPTVRSAGAPLTGLQGTVTGFVANETLASATSGTAVFSAPAGVLNQPGSYAVFGSGLTAMNYSFVQAPGNAQALSIVGLGATVSGALSVNQNLRSIPLPQAPPTLDVGGLVNLLLGPVFDAASVPNGNFGPTLVTGLSPDGIMQLLSGRDRYKDQLLADARTRLELAPDLANLRQCPSLEEAQQGKCLVSETLKNRAEQQRTLLATARARELALIANPTASLDNLPPTAAGPIESLPPSDPTRLAEQANRQASAANATVDAAAASSEIAPELLALARPTLREPPLPAIDPLQTQLDLLLTNYRIKTAVLPQIERKIAIVVGVDVYADSTIPSLGNAVRDARAVAKMFESRLGYETIVLENATRSSVVGALNRLALTMEPQDSVIVYYAGHGDVVEATGLGYWLLSDSKALDPTTWLSNSDINRLVGQISAHQVALISDSCYSGTLTTGDRIRAKALPPDPQDVLSRKTVVVMTSGGNEPVFDEGRDGHSLFAWNLLNVLGKVNQWQPGGNVFERIRFEVARALPQRPQYSDSRSGGSQPGGDFLYEYRQLEAPK